MDKNNRSPMGAFYNATKVLLGTSNNHKGFFLESIERNVRSYKEGGRRCHFEYDCDVVLKYNPRYGKYLEGEKKKLGENSDEYQMSYKLKWILERGMFITAERLQDLGDETYEVCLMDTQKQHVVGIDLGKKNDSTVVTIGEVDWDNPILVETSDDSEIPDYVAYNVWIKAWLEIQGDNWEEQYFIIKDFLNNFNIVRMVIDSTGVGDVLYDRFRANVHYEVIPYTFSLQSKSALYKHYNTELRCDRVHYPAGEQTQQSIEYEKFIQQHEDLEKNYKGQLMVVSHPDVAGAHDDFPDSSALMVWGAKGEGVSRPETSNTNPLYDSSINRGFNNQRNQLTAKRR